MPNDPTGAPITGASPDPSPPTPAAPEARMDGGSTGPTGAEPADVTQLRDEVARLRRVEERWRGDQPLVSALVQAGVRSTDDVQGLLSVREQAARLPEGINLEQMVSAFARQEPDPAAGDGGLTAETIAEVVRTEFVNRDTASAEAEHNRGKSVQDQMQTTLVNELSQGASEVQKRFIARAVSEHVAETRQLYDSGHPLRERDLRPLSADGFAKVKASVLSELDEVMGSTLASLAAAAPTATPSQTAAPGGLGGPGQTPTDGRFRNRSKEDRLALAKSIMAAHGGGPVSSA